MTASAATSALTTIKFAVVSFPPRGPTRNTAYVVFRNSLTHKVLHHWRQLLRSRRRGIRPTCIRRYITRSNHTWSRTAIPCDAVPAG